MDNSSNSHIFENDLRQPSPILFRLNFELGDGISAKLTVREGDDFNMLANLFVEEH